MQESRLQDQIVQRSSAIAFAVKSSTSAGLNDYAKGLETLYMEILNLTRGWNLQSANFSDANAHAIDLKDEKARVAVQVTVTASGKKIRDTISLFKQNKLDDQFDTLYIVGIDTVGETRYMEPWVKLMNHSAMTRVTGLSVAKLQTLERRLADSIEWHKFVQESDAHCFDVVMSVLNRDAIRHSTGIEGDFDDMVKGLNEIKQIVTAGQIPSTQVRAKVAALYDQEYQEILDDIDVSIGTMKRLIQRNKVSSTIVPHKIATQVDQERRELVERVNAFCEKHDHAGRISIVS
ncbi:SMEK domain-containing protein [Citricoccus zhacaiensis]